MQKTTPPPAIGFCIVLLLLFTNIPIADAYEIVQLDNVWLQELKVRVGGGSWGLVTYSGTAVSWGYNQLGGGIYDNFEWFENGTYVVEGENILIVVDKQELDFWADGDWYLLWSENIVRPAPVPENFSVETYDYNENSIEFYYPDSTEFYIARLENYSFYFDKAYGKLTEIFGEVESLLADEDNRLMIVYFLAGRGQYGLTGDLVSVTGIRISDYNLGTAFHEIGHAFTGGAKWSAEWWARFSLAYLEDNLGLDNIYTTGNIKESYLRRLTIYESIGAPFENSVPFLQMEGIIFALSENFGYEKLENTRFKYAPVGNEREDAINFMYQLYPAFGENMWAFFENWNFPVNEDTDNDGLTNKQEIELGWNTFTLADGDQDNLNDSEEFAWSTDPWVWDTDNDGLSDGEEVKIYGTNPLLADSDGDGISDYEEVQSSTTGQPGSGDYSILIFVPIVIAVAAALFVKKRQKVATKEISSKEFEGW